MASTCSAGYFSCNSERLTPTSYIELFSLRTYYGYCFTLQSTTGHYNSTSSCQYAPPQHDHLSATPSSSHSPVEYGSHAPVFFLIHKYLIRVYQTTVTSTFARPWRQQHEIQPPRNRRLIDMPRRVKYIWFLWWNPLKSLLSVIGRWFFWVEDKNQTTNRGATLAIGRSGAQLWACTLLTSGACRLST